MSSILEALKKLEAEKNAQVAFDEPAPVYQPDYSAPALVGNLGATSLAANRLLPFTLIVAGALCIVTLVGIFVLLAVVLLQQGRPAAPPVEIAQAPPVATVQPPPAAAVAAESNENPEETPAAPEVETVTTVIALPSEPQIISKPDPPARPAAPRRETPVVASVATDVHYEPYVPEPAGGSRGETRSAPLPSDIRQLPMLSRSERSQYRLEDVRLNMLNVANANRPTANAIINMEKVFVGETLPGSNARLIDVQNHGIAVEIMSTKQRYYIPQ